MVNDLRLWRSEATESFYFGRFNSGDYQGAVADKVFAENITKVLYPNDEEIQGKELRLQQQYFFTSCSLQDMIRFHLRFGRPLDNFHEKWADPTQRHTSVDWRGRTDAPADRRAWHGLGPGLEHYQPYFQLHQSHLVARSAGALAAAMFGSLLPRHLEIIYEINRRFLDEVRAKFPGDEAKVARMSLIDEHDQKYVRMAYLACVGSHTVNGVAELHSELLKKELFHDFYELWPDKFINITNGVTPRRWLAVSNPEQSAADDQQDRRGLDLRSGSAAPAGEVCRRRGLPGRLAQGAARRERAAGALHQGGHRGYC